MNTRQPGLRDSRCTCPFTVNVIEDNDLRSCSVWDVVNTNVPRIYSL